MIKTFLFDRWCDMKHCERKMLSRREELNASMRKKRIQSMHFIKSLEGNGSKSLDLEAELRMLMLTVDCDTFSNEE